MKASPQSSTLSPDGRGATALPPWLRALVAWTPLVAWSLAIFVVSSGPLPEYLRPGFSLGDKLGHVWIYAVWGALAVWAGLLCWPRLGSARLALFGWIGGTIYGLSDELHQLWVPGRRGEVGDLIADSVGSLLGAGLFVIVWGVVRHHRKPPSDSS